VTNRQIGEQSDEVHQEMEYDRYQAEQAGKSWWEHLAGSVRGSKR
jgi:hypothetical protein